jgi:hypothetical protein
MRMFRALSVGACLLLLTPPTVSAQVQLSLHDGRVTIVATNATVRQILAEWARVGQTRIVNSERIPGGPLTLQLTDMPEQEALDILLRSVTGYMAAPRPASVASLSRYDRILVLPTAVAARPAVSAAAAPVFQPPVQPRVPDDIPDTEEHPNMMQPPRGPLFPTLAQPPQGGAQMGGETPGMFQPQPEGDDIPPGVGMPGSTPGVFPPSPGGTAVGTPRPGMIVQPPVQPGVVTPGQPPIPSPDN